MRIRDWSSDVCSSDLQGGADASGRNHARFAFVPASIDFALLTHAPIDHSGLLPTLVRDCFRGSIHTTTATADLLGVMLPDSAHIQESDARRAARRGHGAASEPIYTQRDVAACLAQVQAVDYESDLVPNRTVPCRFRDAGHKSGRAHV